MKIVINKCFGGFGLSPEATLKLWALGCKGLDVTSVDEYWPLERREEEERKYPTLGYSKALTDWRSYLASSPDEKAKRHLFLNVFSPDERYVINARDVERNDPRLIQVVEEMGDAASGDCGQLAIVEIPDGIEYIVEEYDGLEHVAEKHRTWA